MEIGLLVFNILIGIIILLLGWWGNHLQNRVDAIYSNLGAFEVNVAQNYTTKDDIQTIKREITEDINALRGETKEGFKEIKDILKEKADKK